MNIIAIIPARYDSTRFPGKPLAMINGKPIIQYVWEAASRASLISRAAIATDDERIFKKVKEFGGEAWMTSAHHTTGTDRITEVAKKIEADIIVNVQGDEPLIEPAVIDEAVKPLLNNSEIFMATLKTRIINSEELNDPNVVKVVTDRDGFALYFSRFPIPYVREQGQGASLPLQVVSRGGKGQGYDINSSALHCKHIGLYVYRKDFLLKFAQMKPTPLEEAEKLEQLRVLENGYKIKVVETAYQSVGVDTPEDLERVKEILKTKT
ncbi:MAG: 3-deoxy-manno-octulosonate cytidylyltransferase [Nitrospinae bacterium]|nr:3-deoxy-manno-octulosonate cytidylyltransferase [Nitrospinota bacterium]